MPYKPAHPCAYPGCPKLTRERYCEEHERLYQANYRKYERDPEINRRYGRAWKRIRDRYVAAHPLCERCLEQGRYTPTQEVHHIIPLADGGTHVDSNLMALCKSCHRAITAEMGDLFAGRARGGARRG